MKRSLRCGRVIGVFGIILSTLLGGCTGDDGFYLPVDPGGLVSASPESGTVIDVNATILLTFSGTLGDVKVNDGTVVRSGPKTWVVKGPFSPGPLSRLKLKVTWDTDYVILIYSVREKK